MNTIGRIKQLKYPKEFRILPVECPINILIQLEGLIKNLQREKTISPDVDINNKEFLVEVSVGAWRLKKKMIDPVNNQPLREMSRAYRHLESILLTLEKEGIEIQDHDRQPFDAGLSLKVLTYQPTPDLNKEYVLDTIKPSIYLRGERILMGEVIVATYNK